MVVFYFIEHRDAFHYPAATLTEIAIQTLAVFYRGLSDGDSLYLASGTRETIPCFVRVEAGRILDDYFDADIHRFDPVIARADYRLRERDSLDGAENKLLARMMNDIGMIALKDFKK